MVYLDTSALVKLVAPEPESAALHAFLQSLPERATSALARVELPRAVRRAGGDTAWLSRAGRILEAVAVIALDDRVLETAARLDPPTLRSLDAIHLASALSLGEGLEAIIAYDQRLAAACRRAGVQVEAPA